MISEREKEEIKKEAKEILDKFANSLEKVKTKKKELKVQTGGFRKEGAGEETDSDFRKRMFENAPRKDGDFILAEKKKW